MSDDEDEYVRVIYGQLIRRNDLRALDRLARGWKACSDTTNQHHAIVAVCEEGTPEALTLLLSHSPVSIPDGLLDVAVLKLDVEKVRILLEDTRNKPTTDMLVTTIGAQHGADHAVNQIVNMLIADARVEVNNAMMVVAIEAENDEVIDRLLLDHRIDPGLAFVEKEKTMSYAIRDKLLMNMRVFWRCSTIDQRRRWYKLRHEAFGCLRDEIVAVATVFIASTPEQLPRETTIVV